MYCVVDVDVDLFRLEREDVLHVVMEKVLRSRIIVGGTGIYTETGRGRSY